MGYRSYISQYVHCVFSTKCRQPMITPILQARLFSYIAGIAREHKMQLLAIGGIEDHVHLFAVTSGYSIGCRSHQIDKRDFFKVDSRNVSRTPRFSMAKRLWGFFNWGERYRKNHSVYSQSSNTS